MLPTVATPICLKDVGQFFLNPGNHALDSFFTTGREPAQVFIIFSSFADAANRFWPITIGCVRSS